MYRKCTNSEVIFRAYMAEFTAAEALRYIELNTFSSYTPCTCTFTVKSVLLVLHNNDIYLLTYLQNSSRGMFNLVAGLNFLFGADLRKIAQNKPSVEKSCLNYIRVGI